MVSWCKRLAFPPGPRETGRALLGEFLLCFKKWRNLLHLGLGKSS